MSIRGWLQRGDIVWFKTMVLPRQPVGADCDVVFTTYQQPAEVQLVRPDGCAVTYVDHLGQVQSLMLEDRQITMRLRP